jgi:hypothetical protein
MRQLCCRSLVSAPGFEGEPPVGGGGSNAGGLPSEVWVSKNFAKKLLTKFRCEFILISG